MAELVLRSEARLEAGPSELFALFGSGDPSLGWLFGSEAEALRRGALVRLTLPLGPHLSATLPAERPYTKAARRASEFWRTAAVQHWNCTR